MSMVLKDSSPPNLVVMGGIWGIFVGEYEIPMKDFVSMVEYALTNSDLWPDDPRLLLVERIQSAKKVAGYNPGSERLELPERTPVSQ